MSFLSGKVGYFVKGVLAATSPAMYMDKWSYEVSCVFVKVNNYLSLGYQEGVAGFVSGKVSAEGPYNTAGANTVIIVPGETTSFFMGFGGATTGFACACIVTKATSSNDAEASGRFAVEADSTGSFALSTQFAMQFGTATL